MAVADTAAVEPWRVTVGDIAAGSVVASVRVQLPTDAYTQQETFAATMEADLGAALAASAVLQVRPAVRLCWCVCVCVRVGFAA